MLPSSFEYVAPSSIDEAVQALVAGGGDAKIMSGGQSLLPMMKLRLASPGTIVDINGIAGLDTLEEADGMLRIGALVRHGDIERSDLIRERYPIIHDASKRIADPLIRNRGTFCGSVAHGDTAGDWATVAATLGPSSTLSARTARSCTARVTFRRRCLRPSSVVTRSWLRREFPVRSPAKGRRI